MSTRIGIIAEGPIDHVLLPPLISTVASEVVGAKWPVLPGDVSELIPIRKTGHGGVLEKLRALTEFLKVNPLGYALFVIVLDRKTSAVQAEVRRLVHGDSRFVIGIAIEEIEAWWLADRHSTLAWIGHTGGTLPKCRYGDASKYAAEKDRDPKRTLNELTELSPRLDSRYGQGNVALAENFVDRHWSVGVRRAEIASQCHQGYGRFERDLSNALRPVLQPAPQRRSR